MTNEEIYAERIAYCFHGEHEGCTTTEEEYKVYEFLVQFANEIRAEAAEKAVDWYNNPDAEYDDLFDDDEYWDNKLRAVITGKETL